MQHRSVAQEPGEEPQHGCSATRSCPGLSGYNRRREQQLCECCSCWQFPPTGCFHCDPSPSAGYHGWFLEARLWLRLYGSCHAKPTQPVKLCLGKVKVLYLLFYWHWFCLAPWGKRNRKMSTQQDLFFCSSLCFRSRGYLNFTWDFSWHRLPLLLLYRTVLRISSFMPFCWALIPDHIDLKARLDNTRPSFSLSLLKLHLWRIGFQYPPATSLFCLRPNFFSWAYISLSWSIPHSFFVTYNNSWNNAWKYTTKFKLFRKQRKTNNFVLKWWK